MIGLDTNILVRFLVKDDEKQYKKVYELFSHDKVTFMIPYPVLVEMMWVLENSYGYKKEQLSLILEEFNNSKNFFYPNRSIVKKALEDYKNGSADFADCLIGALNKEHNCKTTYTFDKKTSNLPSFTLLS